MRLLGGVLVFACGKNTPLGIYRIAMDHATCSPNVITDQLRVIIDRSITLSPRIVSIGESTRELIDGQGFAKSDVLLRPH